MPDRQFMDLSARSQFEDARRREWFAALTDALNHAPHDLLAFEDVRQRLQIHGQKSLGLQTIPLDSIIGSEGRYSDFDRHFLPKTDATRDRWMNINKAAMQYIDLPPIDVYKVGEIYFVRDGNHRVSVARRVGQSFIDANVIELIVDVPITKELTAEVLPLKEEYSDFLEWTQLHVLRPDQRIEFTESGGYLELIRHINGRRYFMGLEQKRPIESVEAVVDWYDNIYMPAIAVIRSQHILEHFPGRTEADLYRWIMEHRWYMLEKSGGRDPGPAAAAADFAQSYATQRWYHGLAQRIASVLNARGESSAD
ncbi:MAG: hypothetical protein RLY87_226 [Chloroflexota bacterium]